MSATCLWSAGGGLPQSSRCRPLPLPCLWLASGTCPELHHSWPEADSPSAGEHRAAEQSA